VKDHAFLVRACGVLKQRGVDFRCEIAGEGPERGALEKLIVSSGLSQEVRLVGHVTRGALAHYYSHADVVVLTSRSEGIPICLMEAMAQGGIVLAPAITGVPELVIDGVTGFLYQPHSLEDFVAKLQMIAELRAGLDQVRRAARQHVTEHFHRQKNLARFADEFLQRLAAQVEGRVHENSLLQ